MRIVFMGTPEFAVASLDALVKNKFTIVAVVTAPDKPAGRGQHLRASAVKEYALKEKLKVLQPSNLKDTQFIEELTSLKADLQIVVAFRMLPEAIWNMPPMGTFNLHASLLPKYRGAAPINWAIINGETKTGVTTFKLVQEIDAGNILYQEEVEITPSMNAGELHDVLMVRGAEVIVKTVKAIECSDKEPLRFISQNKEEVTHAPKIYRETCKINWDREGLDIHNLIRGLSPYPAAHCMLMRGDEKPVQLKIFKAEFKKQKHQFTNGSLLTDKIEYLSVSCMDGLITVQELQLEGKRRMSVKEFLKGFRLDNETCVA